MPVRVRMVARSPHLAGLRLLQLRYCDAGDAGCEEIVSSGLLGRLDLLDLAHGIITDEGARRLAACPEECRAACPAGSSPSPRSRQSIQARKLACGLRYRAAGSRSASSAVSSPVLASTCATTASSHGRALRSIGREIPGFGNMAKLALSHILRLTRDASAAIVGPAALLHSYDDDRAALDDATGRPELAAVTESILFAPGPSIYGGTDEIQHNINGERVLGLPREPSVDRDKPFREIPKNA